VTEPGAVDDRRRRQIFAARRPQGLNWLKNPALEPEPGRVRNRPPHHKQVIVF
jgi:hypothetical protein